MIKQHPLHQYLFGCLVCILFAFTLLAALPSSAQVWSCAEGYTNNPNGKTACHQAGAGPVCAKGGDRYFAPLRADPYSSEESSCSRQEIASIGLLSEQAAKEIRYAKEVVYDKVSATLLSAKKYFPVRSGNSEKKKVQRVGDPQYGDLFSCFIGAAGLGECSIAELNSFVETTFTQASDALK